LVIAAGNFNYRSTEREETGIRLVDIGPHSVIDHVHHRGK